jgi:hypothetical protein
VVVEYRPSIQIEERTLELLKEVAQRRQISLEEVVRESIEEYVAREARAHKLDQIVDRLMVEHAWLLDELAKR